MAKKKRARPKGPRAKWPDSDRNALLAWLDHTLKHKELDFENTIVSHLHQAYTLPQIHRKLESLWTTYGPADKLGFPRSTWRGDIFSFGSTCLGLGDNELEEIYMETEALDGEHRSAQIPLATRRLRSSSRQTDISLTPQTTVGTPTKKARTPQRQRLRPPSTSLTPFAIKREIEQTESPSESANKRPHRLSERSATTFSATTQRKTTNKQPKAHQKSQIPQTRSLDVVDDSEDDLSDILSEDLEHYGEPKEETRCICGAIEEYQEPEGLTEDDKDVGWIQCTGCSVWQHELCVKSSFDGDINPEDYSCEVCKPSAHKSECNRQSSSHTVNEASTGPIDRTPGSKSAEPTSRTALTTPTLHSLIAVENSISANHTRLENAREKIKELEEEMLELKLDLNVSEGSVAALERQLSSLRAAQKWRDEQSGFPIEELIERNINTEKRLLAAGRIRDEGSKFTTLVAKSREWFGTTKVDEGFYDIYGQSRQALCRGDNDTVPFIPSLVKYEGLRNLVSKCLSISPEDPKKAQEETSKFSRFSPEAVVRALINSALAEWVFETDFPQFDDSSSDVLSKYRELLVTQDGAVTLRNLDLGARVALTKSVSFRQQRIPETAKALAVKLSQTLAPFFSNTSEAPEESDWDGFATWRDDKDEWTDRRKRFTQMFKFALETKSDSCLNIQDYEMLIYPPGTKFDKKTMEVETRSCVKDTTSNHNGRTVELCMEAAVFAHGRKAVSEDSSIAEAVISSRNFVCKERKDRVGIEPAVKAVVILADQPEVIAR